MGDLYSMAYSSMSSHSFSSLGRDLHNNLGILNADMPPFMDSSLNTTSFFSSLDSDLSTGYLEDALIEFQDRSKRRRLLLYTEDHHDAKAFENNDHVKNYWNSDCTWDLPEFFNWMSGTTGIHKVSDIEHINSSESQIRKDAAVSKETKTQEAEISVPDSTVDSSSSSYTGSVNTMSISDKSTVSSIDRFPLSEYKEIKKNKRVITRVVYPFALVKPGGAEDVVTLNDINERILMPPTRPVKHPVGDFAYRPCVHANGTGISGKAVVALTRIQTQGRGTITIIRTKG